MSRIVLHIDRLVLHGIDRHDADAVARALQNGLAAELLAPQAIQALTQIAANNIRVNLPASMPQSSTGQTGAAIAGAIAGGLGIAPDKYSSRGGQHGR